MTAIIVIILVLAVTVFVIKNLIADSSRSRHSSSAVHKDEAQMVQSQQKPNKVARNKQNSHSSTTSKLKAKKSNVIGNTATVLAGAALAHQIIKHHKPMMIL